MTEDQKMQYIDLLKKEISQNVIEGISYYMIASIIQGLAQEHNPRLMQNIKEGFDYGLDAFKKNYKGMLGMSIQGNEGLEKIIESLDIPSLIETTQQPYQLILEKAIELSKQSETE